MTTELKYSKNDVVSMLNEDARLTEQALHGYLAANDVYLQVLFDAERYSVFAGGKRIRPAMVLEFCRLFGGDERAALPFAAAVEMIRNPPTQTQRNRGVLKRKAFRL